MSTKSKTYSLECSSCELSLDITQTDGQDTGFGTVDRHDISYCPVCGDSDVTVSEAPPRNVDGGSAGETKPAPSGKDSPAL